MKIIIIISLLLGFFGWAFIVMAAAPENTVLRVKDGDTIEVMGAGRKPYTVRLSGIDAPENGQAWGNKSRKLLKKLIHKKIVRVVAKKEPDFYGRIVARLYIGGLDAPEKKQPYGKKSKKALSKLVYKKIVRVKAANKPDRYKRTLARLYVEDEDINAAMVRQGAAWVYRRYTRDKSLYKAEAQAKAAQRGLWALENPVPPWKWRKN